MQLDIIRNLSIEKIFNQSRYNKTDIRFGFSSVRRFQRIQNRRNPITESGVIDRQSSMLHIQWLSKVLHHLTPSKFKIKLLVLI